MTVIAPPAPRIYVACLAAYNNGELHGAWIDLAGKDADDVNDEIQAILASSPQPGAEEYAIHDHDGLGGGIGEYDSIASIIAKADAIVEHGPAFIGWLAVADAVEAEEPEKFDEAFAGEWDDEDAYYVDLAETYIEVFKGNLDEAQTRQFEEIEGSINLVHYGKNLDGFDIRFARVDGRLFAFRSNI